MKQSFPFTLELSHHQLPINHVILKQLVNCFLFVSKEYERQSFCFVGYDTELRIKKATCNWQFSLFWQGSNQQICWQWKQVADLPVTTRWHWVKRERPCCILSIWLKVLSSTCMRTNPWRNKTKHTEHSLSLFKVERVEKTRACIKQMTPAGKCP